MKPTFTSDEGGRAFAASTTPAKAQRNPLNRVLRARLLDLLLVLALAGAYYAAAKLGLTLALVAEQVSPVWPPTGIALAAVLLAGYRVWPGIALGAFLANATANEPILTAAGIAVGNTLEALVGAWLLQTQWDFRCRLERLTDVLGLVVLAAALSTMVSATIGVASLCLGGVQPGTAYGFLWRVWWLGDAMGALVVAPVILTGPDLLRIARRPYTAIEMLGLLAALALVCLVVFGGHRLAVAGHPLEISVFPFLIWAALRLGPAGTAFVTLVASTIAIVGATQGNGPFTRGNVHDSLVLLQLFLAVMAVTGLVLSAALSERDTAARRRSIHDAVTQALVGSAGVAAAIPRMLHATCDLLNWDVGALWVVDQSSLALRCEAFWGNPARNVADFEMATRERTFAHGVGLPGRVWSSGQPAWIADVLADDNFPRAREAARAGLRGAFGFPIIRGGAVWGVIEFFSRHIQAPDADLLHTMDAIGGQIGLFLDRRRSEAAQLRLAAILEATTDFVAMADRHGRSTYVNRAGRRLVGLTDSDDVTERTIFDYVPPWAAQLIREVGLPAAIRDGAWSGETALQHSDGREIPVSQVILAHRSAQGAVEYLSTIARDTTARRQAEEAQKEADRRKDEFLAMLAHELRNPLAPVLNAVHILRLVGANEALVRQQSEMIARQVQQMKRLLDDLLDVSRITRGQVPLRKEPAELGDILTQAIETSRPLLEAKRHELTVDRPAGAIRLEGDPTRLAQVFTNLLNNAAKYTEAGGHIALTVDSAADSVRVRIKDTGIGMAPELLGSAFDLFVQADHSLDRSEGGLGIGLTLVKRLVEMHGGSVEARSDGLGRGSEFVVRLPRLPDDIPADRSVLEPAAPAASAGARRILVVEDNVDAAQSLALLLQMQGQDVRVAVNGPVGLHVAATFIPDVVLLDIGLPGMDGFEVARQLRRQPALTGTLIVALTGYGQEEDRDRAREAGCDYHLVKPVDPQALLELLASKVTVTSERI